MGDGIRRGSESYLEIKKKTHAIWRILATFNVLTLWMRSFYTL